MILRQALAQTRAPRTETQARAEPRSEVSASYAMQAGARTLHIGRTFHVPGRARQRQRNMHARILRAIEAGYVIAACASIGIILSYI